MATVTFDHMYKRYGEDVIAVNDLNLEIKDGEFLVLVGPSGCGKTTALRCVAGLEDISDGRLLIGDRVVNNVAPKDRDIAMVFQSYALYPHMTVYDNLAFGLKLRKLKKDEIDRRVKEGAAILGLERFLERKPKALSGGQRQRVALAAALVGRPELVFLDEPTAGLDPQSRLALWEVIGELHADGQTILLTTHYMEEADQLCDRVAIMDHGRILALDTPAALKRSVGADTEIRITPDDGQAPDLARHLEGYHGVQGVNATDGIVRVYLRADHGGLARLIAHAAGGGFEITDVGITEPTLEAVFIDLTGKDLRE
jgi:multiple sugar transport system ATP-binding protein